MSPKELEKLVLAGGRFGDVGPGESPKWLRAQYPEFDECRERLVMCRWYNPMSEQGEGK